MSDSRQKWLQEEIDETKQMLNNFWVKYININPKTEAANKMAEAFKSFIKKCPPFPIPEDDKEWLRSIDDAFGSHVPFLALERINPWLIRYGLIDCGMSSEDKDIEARKREEKEAKIGEQEIDSLTQYIGSRSVSVSISTPDTTYSTSNSKDSFAMHSVGKVFTGILALIMIQQGIITEKELNEPIKIDEESKELLPEEIRKHLEEKKITLFQLMIHEGGLGDYVKNNYATEIQNALKENQPPPEIKQPEDFLKFAEKKLFEPDKYEYSNLGILLVGLAIKHAYNNKEHVNLGYNDILNKFILNEVGMPSFSPWMPENGKYNKNAEYTKYLVGSPAGGYWVNAEDLGKFGQWLYNKCAKEHDFKVIVEKYGKEFYNDKNPDKIFHIGGIPSSTAYFSVSLKTGNVVVALSDQPSVAFEVGDRVVTNIFSKPSLSTSNVLKKQTFAESPVDSNTAKTSESSTKMLMKKGVASKELHVTKKMATDDIALQPTKAKKATQEFAQPIEKDRATTTDDSNITYGKRPGK